MSMSLQGQNNVQRLLNNITRHNNDRVIFTCWGAEIVHVA